MLMPWCSGICWVKGTMSLSVTVKVPLKPQNVMYAGLQQTTDMETAFIKRLNLRKAGVRRGKGGERVSPIKYILTL